MAIETQYAPEYPPQNQAEFSNYLFRELNRIAAILELGKAGFFTFLAAAPDKPKEGFVAGADGVNWDPTLEGKGIYVYYGGSWHKLG